MGPADVAPEGGFVKPIENKQLLKQYQGNITQAG